VDRLGLEGDEQADLSVHGGIEKAVYAYPIEHYPRWQAWLARAERMQYGTLGENLSTQGVVESDLWIGDEMQFDKCVLRVESPRRPCFKLNAVLDNEQAGRFMLAQALTGWYLRVVTPGTLRAGDAFVIVPGPRQTSLPERQRQMIRPADTR
jgi:MOSC domain-containing protein YiiM